MKNYLLARTWCNERIESEDVGVRIILVRAPLTFGHSQVIACFPKCRLHDEFERFRVIAPFIERALAAFGLVFGKQGVHKKIELASLANLTMTEGNYVKTLILRTSANENDNEYKVHLVPYFRSHASSAKGMYTATHSVAPEDTGGLLAWLGARETMADCWQNESDNPFTQSLDDVWETVLRLPYLNDLLVEAWASEERGLTG